MVEPAAPSPDRSGSASPDPAASFPVPAGPDHVETFALRRESPPRVTLPRPTVAPPAKSLLARRLPLEHETALFLLISLLDILMTVKLLIAGPFHEANPVARFVLFHWGVVGMAWYKLALCAFICVVAQIVALQSEAKGRWILRFGIAVTAVVVIYSAGLWIRHR